MLLKLLSKLSIVAMLGGALLGAAPVHAAGTIPLALAVQTDTDGSIAAACQATFYQAGTVATKQNVYSDFGLTQAMANPLSCDQSGRLPMFWIADGLIHVRLTNSNGNPIVDTTMQVLGPSSGGGGGGGTVDPTSIAASGDMKAKYQTGPLAGWVRANGLTIGSASSGASERANADTQALFVFLCGSDPNLVMTPARSGNCLSDFNANKQLALPDFRGAWMAGLADMGNSPISILTSTYFGGSVTTLGGAGGGQSQILTTPNLPPYTPSGSVAISSNSGPQVGYINTATSGNVGFGGASTGASFTQPSFGAIFTGAAQGGSSSPFATLPPTRLVTFYIKL